jgi:hypothetical protein
MEILRYREFRLCARAGAVRFTVADDIRAIKRSPRVHSCGMGAAVFTARRSVPYFAAGMLSEIPCPGDAMQSVTPVLADRGRERR